MFKYITWFRCYVFASICAVSGYSYAEYYGYQILGSDETSSGGSHVRTTIGGSSIHHK